MRVALVSSGLEPMPVKRGGSVDTYVYNVATSLAKLGVDVTVFTNPKSKIEGVRIERIPFPVTSSPKMNYGLYNLSVLFKLLRHRKEYDLIHVNMGSTGWLLTKFFDNVVFTSHSAYWWRPADEHWMQVATVKEARAVIAISHYIEKEMRKHRKKGIFYVPNGVDTELFKPASPKSDSAPVLLSVGSITDQKGLVYMAEAMKILLKENKSLRWVHVGPGNNDDNPYYRELLAALGKAKDNCTFAGRVPLENLIDYYQSADVFVMPSKWEGMPLVVLEAMSCGLPIVATKISGVEELVRDGENGKLVRPEDPIALAKTLQSLLEDAKKMKRMGGSAREITEKEYSWKSVAKRLLQVYKKCL